jgi:hypothetical protein
MPRRASNVAYRILHIAQKDRQPTSMGMPRNWLRFRHTEGRMFEDDSYNFRSILDCRSVQNTDRLFAIGICNPSALSPRNIIWGRCERQVRRMQRHALSCSASCRVFEPPLTLYAQLLQSEPGDNPGTICRSILRNNTHSARDSGR